METIETTRRDQLLRQGRGQKIIQILAQNGVKRAELQRALRQHVEGLRQAIDEDTTIFPDQKKQLQAQVDKFDKSVNAKVLGIERAVRELLQIEFAWISISEAASIKRLSWITSLFGMNVNLLDDNPDWRWYLVLGGASLLFTVIMWTLFKFVPIESWLEAKWLLFRRPRNAHVGSKV
ncbi:hypothetical protein BO71DRAFT_3305 [Aspergillus ellipticus CBS 707.79]|uniref:Uncharacterized protein n=1 Tax=Aspergillus ellipticus CBS 707.79 TaxID=1448320 RepID=A0A319DN22_9EURO|nr:hypothetical protein BO71DRAFT_3305 [Aspergillus ellipticus CBS 707.79]